MPNPDSRARFQRAVDSQFKHLGADAIYRPADPTKEELSIRVIPKRPELLFGLGEEDLHSENPQFECRISEVVDPRRGDCIQYLERWYQIIEEPRADPHQLIWMLTTLPVYSR